MLKQSIYFKSVGVATEITNNKITTTITILTNNDKHSAIENSIN